MVSFWSSEAVYSWHGSRTWLPAACPRGSQLREINISLGVEKHEEERDEAARVGTGKGGEGRRGGRAEEAREETRTRWEGGRALVDLARSRPSVAVVPRVNSTAAVARVNPRQRSRPRPPPRGGFLAGCAPVWWSEVTVITSHRRNADSVVDNACHVRGPCHPSPRPLPFSATVAYAHYAHPPCTLMYLNASAGTR